MTHHATFNLSPTHKTFSQLFWVTLLGLPSLRNEEVASFLVKCRLYSWPRSLLIFCLMALVFTPFNSTKTLFSYGVCYNELRSRMRKLDTIKETGKSHIWPYFRATKWCLETNRTYYCNYCLHATGLLHKVLSWSDESMNETDDKVLANSIGNTVVWTQNLLATWWRIWGKTLIRIVLSTEMLPSVLMGKRMPHQPTSVWVLLMTGSEYTVEHRNFENWNSTWPIALKIWKRSWQNLKTVSFQQDTSKLGYSPDPSPWGQKGLGPD